VKQMINSTRRFHLPMALVFLFTLTTAVSAAKAKTNLLIIETDEHHYNTLSCYGGQIVNTKHIDWIAQNGARCTSFYATTPVCSPSRASLLTGLYPQATPVVNNNIPLSDDMVTFAELLKREGYATGYAGKWHLDGAGKPQWAPERNFGFTDNRFMFNRGHWKKFIDTPTGPQVGAKDKKGKPSYGLDGADETSFSTDWLCNKAVNFIHEHADEPFCYMVNLPDPHGPNTVRAPYDTMYEDVDVPIPVTLTRTPDQIPAWGKPAGVKPAQLRKLMINYYGMVKCIDDNVGKLIDTLREKEILDRTIIVFTSDHGDLCGEHGRLNKGVPYEGSARIPFLIYCPGSVPKATTIDQALSNVDFLPTVMNLMDVPVTIKVAGRDASALFRGKQVNEWNDITVIRSTGGKQGDGNAWIAAISERYKLVYSAVEEPWLIDLKNDPNEVSNLFGNPKLKDVIQTMTAHLQAYGSSQDDPYLQQPRIRSWVQQGLGSREQ